MKKINIAEFVRKYNRQINKDLRVGYVVNQNPQTENEEILIEDFLDDKVMTILQTLLANKIIPKIGEKIYGYIQYSISGIEYEILETNQPIIIFYLNNEEKL